MATDYALNAFIGLDGVKCNSRLPPVIKYLSQLDLLKIKSLLQYFDYDRFLSCVHQQVQCE